MSWRARIRAEIGELSLDLELDGDAGVLALVGPNGSGKTSLLRVLAGALRPVTGEIEIDGERVLCSEEGVDLPAEARRVGYLPQGYGLFPHLKVVDNVGFGLAAGPRRCPRSERRRRARALLDELGCAQLADRLPAKLSGGEQQRVALARALIVEPKLLLLDEPLAALDATARRSVRRFLARRLRALGRPSIVVTHDHRDVEALGAQVCVIEAGRVVQRGDLEALRAAPASDFVAEFAAI